MPKYPDMKSLVNNAEQRGFRTPRENETEKEFRSAFANFMMNIDMFEAMEISDDTDIKISINKQKPFALATFNADGKYEFRLYEGNENYADDYSSLNVKGWVTKLYADPLVQNAERINSMENELLMAGEAISNQRKKIQALTAQVEELTKQITKPASALVFDIATEKELYKEPVGRFYAMGIGKQYISTFVNFLEGQDFVGMDVFLSPSVADAKLVEALKVIANHADTTFTRHLITIAKSALTSIK